MRSIYLSFFIVFLTIFASIPAETRAADAFTVSDIKVSGEGANAVEAKNNAIATGQNEAFQKLLGNITPPSSASLWPHPSKDELADLVSGFDIKDEKITAKRYSATLNISFNRSLVENMLQTAGITYVTKKGEAVILLPLLQQGSDIFLWQTDQAWRTAWEAAIKYSGFLNLVIPAGDDKDAATIDVARIAKGVYPLEEDQKNGIDNLMRRYKAKKVLLAKAITGTSEGKISVEVELTWLNDLTPEKIIKKYHAENASDTMDIVMNKAIKDIIAGMENKWKEGRGIPSGDESSLNVTVPVANMEEWSRIYKDLGRMDFISRIELKYITTKYVSVDLYSYGSSEALEEKLGENGFYIDKTENGAFLRKGTSPKPDGATDELQR